MKSYSTTQNTLEGAWLHALRAVMSNGRKLSDKEPFIEQRNVSVTYTNAFETRCEQYRSIFGDTFLEYIHKVYSPGGDPASGRNYHKLIRSGSSGDQVQNTIEKLKKDPLTRSGTIVLADPSAPKQPCVSEINFSIREDLLHMTVLFKSSDLAKKFVPDMLELSSVHTEIARELNIARGSVTAFILSAQVYVSDFEQVVPAIARLKESHYFNTGAVRDNWDKEAETWDSEIESPTHYVNIENGYSRFLDFMHRTVKKVSRSEERVALDSGCGTGIIARELNTKGYKVVAVDISPKMLEHADKKASSRQYVLANSLDLPYQDNYFDLVCTRGVLFSHVGKAYTEQFLKEHHRVLKTGGLLIFDFITHFEKEESGNRRRKASIYFNELQKTLEVHGLEVIGRSGEDTNRVNAVACVKK